MTVIAKEDDAMSLWNGDYVEILLETPSRAYYQIAVNPLGVMTDMDRGGRRKEIRWDSGAKAAAHVGEDYWSVELRVPTTEKQAILTPLEGVAGTKPTRELPWHVNACRVRRSGRRVEASVLSSTGEGRREFHDTRRFARFHVVEGQ